MAQWRRCTNATALRFGRNYYLLTIAVAFTLWLCDQHFCVHLHGLPGMSQTAAVTGRSVRAVSTALPTGRLRLPRAAGKGVLKGGGFEERKAGAVRGHVRGDLLLCFSFQY